MKYKILLLVGFSNILEWLDFGLLIYLAPIIGAHFFPTTTTLNASLEVYTAFAIGFLCRPLGGIIFGHIGDRAGRSKALCFSVFGVALSTCGVGLLPSYHTLGLLSTVLLILLRLIQGICIGGEYTGVGVYIAESSVYSRRGFFTSFAASGANFGFLLAILMVIQLKLTLPQSELMDWGWRIPFILAGCLGLCILLWRLKLVETRSYLSLDRGRASALPLVTTFQKSPSALLNMIAVTAMGSTFYMIFFAFLPNYLEKVGTSSIQTLWVQIAALSGMIFFIPLSGYLGDYLGRKYLLTLVGFSILFLVLPGFYGLMHTQSLGVYALVLGVAALISALEQGNTMSFATENFATEIRYSGVALSYNIGNALFGGTAPLIAELLAKQERLFYLEVYLMVICVFALFAVQGLRNKSAPT